MRDIREARRADFVFFRWVSNGVLTIEEADQIRKNCFLASLMLLTSEPMCVAIERGEFATVQEAVDFSKRISSYGTVDILLSPEMAPLLQNNTFTLRTAVDYIKHNLTHSNWRTRLLQHQGMSPLPLRDDNISVEQAPTSELPESTSEMNIKQTIDLLTPFICDPRIAALLGLTAERQPLNPDTISKAEFERLRTELVTLLSEEDLHQERNQANNKALGDTIHKVLIGLTKLNPINSEDYLTLEEIPADKSVMVSTGHQFDIEKLISYHTVRDYRGADLRETPTSKCLLNPSTNTPFCQRDTQHIQDTAREKGMTIPYLKTNDPVRPNQTIRGQRNRAATPLSDIILTRGIIVRDYIEPWHFRARDDDTPLIIPIVGTTHQDWSLHPAEMQHDLLAAIQGLDQPVREILLSHQTEVARLVNSANISLRQLTDIYARNPDFLNEAIRESFAFTRLIGRAHIPVDAFFNLDFALRTRICANDVQVSQLVIEGHVSAEQLPILFTISLNNFPGVMRQLLYPECLRALRNGVTTLERLASMTAVELCEANFSGDYPAAAPGLVR